jgi:hemerythrin-like domain-containing protein
MSTYILGSDDADTLRRFAAEVAPAVRELVAAARSSAAAPAGAVAAPARPHIDVSQRFAVVPTPDDGRRYGSDQPWDESSRPVGPAPEPGRTYRPDELAAGRHLIDVHDMLRTELTQLRDVVAQVAQGAMAAGAARSLINTMALRQNNWTLGAFCESYCRIVTGHHGLEDSSVFPHLRRSDPRLAPVLDRLQDEHEVIADVLDQVDEALVGLVTRPDGMGEVQAAVDLLTDTLLSHLSYEERELVEPLARVGFY